MGFLELAPVNVSWLFLALDHEGFPGQHLPP